MVFKFSENDNSHVQIKYGTIEDLNYFLMTIPSKNFISLTKDKGKYWVLLYIED